MLIGIYYFIIFCEILDVIVSFFLESFEFEMVVVVSNEVEINSLEDLRGKRLCHPGFDENGWLNNDWSEVFSQV